MRYSFRLAQLLGHDPDPKKRPGTVKSIVDFTGLDRHKVAALLRNEVRYVPLDAISRICEYLIHHRIATPDQLPAALFGVEPESFWELLARRESLHFCLGMRQGLDSSYPDDAWVVTADSLLLGVLLNGVSTLGGTAKYYPKSDAPPEASQTVARTAPHPDEYIQSLVLAPQQGNEQLIQAKAHRVYEAFENTNKDKALVCLGSVKSNPVIELVLARTFGAEPFVSQDDVPKARHRRCPIWLRFRDQVDYRASSCGGGFRLSQTEKAQRPGIYFERSDGSWGCCPWDLERRDAGLIFYRYAPALARLEMILGGFSSRSTRFLSQVLTLGLTSELWPPVYDSPSLQIGAYVVKFEFEPEPFGDRDILAPGRIGSTEIIPLDPEVIRRRVEQ